MIDDAPTQQLWLGTGPTTVAPPPFPTVPAPRGPWMSGPFMAPSYYPTPPVAPRPRWPWVVGAVAAVVLVLGLAATVLAPSTTVSGTVTLYATSSVAVGSPCEGGSSYSFLYPGASVSVYDAAGALVGTGALAGGTASSSGSSSSYGYGYGYGDACVFTYTVPDVASSDFYRVKVGSSSSDTGVPFSADQVDGNAHIQFGTP